MRKITHDTKYLRSIVLDLRNYKYDIRNSNLNNLVLSYAKGKTFLDVGCGFGNLVNLAKQKGFKASGLDIEHELIDAGKKLYKNVNLYQGSVFDLNKIKDTFDTITTIDVIEHIEDDVRALKSMASKLTPTGHIIIVVPAHELLYGIRDEKLGHFRRYSKALLTQSVEKAGLKVDYIRSWNFLGVLPYFISEKILKKPLHTNIRIKKKSPILVLIQKLLDIWMKVVEKNVNLSFGLSLICIASKK